MAFLYWIFTVTTFIGGTLLFVIQPMVGKLVLPVFGGVSSVWTTVMLFFTTIVLLGYVYVVWITKRPKNIQLLVHGILIIVSLIWVGINYLSGHSFFPVSGYSPSAFIPAFSLLVLLLKTLGLPCFLLATTSALLQIWHTYSHPGKSPYWLYTVSNTGSLTGLLIYPFILEPHLTLKAQQLTWTFLFAVYGLLLFFVIYITRGAQKTVASDTKKFKIGLSRHLGWFALPFVATGAMLAFTNQITQVIAPVPFVWIATLGIYLLSFILAFVGGKWYSRKFYGLVLICLIAVLTLFTSGFIYFRIQFVFILSLTTLFAVDLVCFKELFRRRPDAEGLGLYYLMIALGGVAASVFVGVAAPSLFPDIWEYPLVLAGATFISAFVLFRKSDSAFRIHTGVFGILIITLIAWMFFYPSKSAMGRQMFETVARFRNFYGVLQVRKSGNSLPYSVELWSGSTMHGAQTIGGSGETTPTTYYSRDSGLGYAIVNSPGSLKRDSLRIGVIGLGTGTTAAYCDKGDTIRFYEINPQVVEASRKHFTFLANAEKSGCKVEIALGDGRISLEEELSAGKKGGFDVLAIDAFTDDAIPTHLLTREAVNLYLSHLADGGILAVHITNRYFDLGPELGAIAAERGLYFNDFGTQMSRWILISGFPTGPRSYIGTLENIKTSPWTDDYSNVFEALY